MAKPRLFGEGATFGVGLPCSGSAIERDSHICHGKHKPKNRRRERHVLFRGDTQKPDPPTLEEWRAPPMPGTEEILRRACFNYKEEAQGGEIPDGPIFYQGVISTPMLLEVEFESKEDVWPYIDSLDEDTLRRQTRKYGLKYHPDPFQMKKDLLELYALQEYYQKEADELMEKRIIKANERAEKRGRRKMKKMATREKIAQMEMFHEEPYAKRPRPEHFSRSVDSDLDSPIWQEHSGWCDEVSSTSLVDVFPVLPDKEISNAENSPPGVQEI